MEELVCAFSAVAPRTLKILAKGHVSVFWEVAPQARSLAKAFVVCELASRARVPGAIHDRERFPRRERPSVWDDSWILSVFLSFASRILGSLLAPLPLALLAPRW